MEKGEVIRIECSTGTARLQGLAEMGNEFFYYLFGMRLFPSRPVCGMIS